MVVAGKPFVVAVIVACPTETGVTIPPATVATASLSLVQATDAPIVSPLAFFTVALTVALPSCGRSTLVGSTVMLAGTLPVTGHAAIGEVAELRGVGAPVGKSTRTSPVQAQPDKPRIAAVAF